MIRSLKIFSLHLVKMQYVDVSKLKGIKNKSRSVF